mgnify:CR=1 FL=1
MKFRLFILLLTGFGLTSCAVISPQKVEPEIKTMDKAYIGTYTKKEGHVDGKAEGIYAISQNPQTGALKLTGTVAEMTNPSYVKTSPDGKYLYAVSELGPGDAEFGFVHAFRILPEFQLEEINIEPTFGFAPCHIAVDDTGEYVFVSNYLGGVVVLYQKGANGALKQKQLLTMEDPEQSHPHSVTLSGDNKLAYIADLGNDRIWIYNFDPEEGILKPHSQVSVALEKGSGPRHLAFAKDGNYIFSMNEVNSSVSSFMVQKDGGLELLHTVSSLPENFKKKNSGADIHVHPSGKFLYVSNRGHNSIAAFEIDQSTGTLTSLGYTDTQGKTPRNFSIDSAGKFLYVANQDTDTISIFKIDPSSGRLTLHLQPLEIKTPVSIDFVE